MALVSSLRGGWRGLPPNARGALWILVGALFFALNDGVVKFLGGSLDPVLMSFFRYGFGFLFLTPFFVRAGRRGLATQRLPLHLLRGVLAGLGQAGIFYAVVHLMLADVTAIAFTRPLFMTFLAIVLLGEVVGWRRWTATAVGFAGAIVIIRPGQGSFDLAWGIALVSALLFGLALIIIRRLSSTEPTIRILFYYHLTGTVMFAGPAVWLWQTPVGVEWFLLLVIGALTTAAMFCFVRGLSVGEASIVGPMDYIRLVYAALIGYFVFAELPSIWTWVGSAIIIVSALYIARHEAMASSRGSARPP